MKFRLQFSVAGLFTILTMIVLGVAVTLFYVSNKELALETAKSAMADAVAKTDTALLNFVAPVGRTVETMVALYAAFPQDAPPFEALRVVDRQISGLDQVYGAFVGMETDGAFHQVIRLPESMKTFGPDNRPVPDGATHVYRLVEQTAAGRKDTYRFLSDSGKAVGEWPGPGDFDPRERPWYVDARDVDHQVVSPVYVFASTGRPGVTFSKRLLGADGRLQGVVGVDISLEAITKILDRIRIGKEGEVFLLDRADKLASWSDYFATNGHGAGAVGNEDDTGGNPVVAAAIDNWKSSGSDFFRLNVPGTDGAFLVSLKPLSPIFNIQPLVGVAVPEREFIGAINQDTRRVLRFTALIMIVAILATMLLARLLSRSLRAVTNEAQRISDFDLSDDFKLTSHIREVSELGAAMSHMKNSLRSFGAYVPKDLVRSIVSSGLSVTIGGTSRELSILFSDIEGFTQKSEGMPPEVLMNDLSRYFEEMEAAISRHHGTIDKYIGDAIMAIWNAPEEDPDHADHACRSALACRAAGKNLNAMVGQSKLFPVRTRFGLHCDRVVVGNVGSTGRFQYTALGGAVNLASRIEGLNKVYATDILVTQNVVDRTGGRFVFRPVDRVSPAGTTVPIEIYELVGEADPGAEYPAAESVCRELQEWSAFYRLYRAQDWVGALAALRAQRASSSRGQLISLYMDRCRQFIEDPPPKDWDGVQTFREK